MAAIGVALKKARERAGMSLRQLEKASGLTASQISQIERGVRRDPGFSTVLKLARAIGIGLDALAGLKEPKAMPPRMARATRASLERAKREAESAAARLGAILEDEA